ncbi:MAG: 3-keto-5-aminohexanoate cleavage protein [Rhodocyclaceae bacterium]|nr:MAG: 3-keto-5-aminohexanoate cleavage protein [Rhodocyclaceae bacterium]
MEPLIINLAPTGLVPTRAHSPHVPLTAEEVAADCQRCWAAGASMLHLHARAVDGSPSCDRAVFGELVAAVRQRVPDAIIITTTSGRRAPEVEQRAASLTLEGEQKPDMASLTLSSLNFNSEASISSPQTVMRLAAIMKEQGIRPELEVFDLGMVNFAKILIDKGLIEPPFYFNILLGNPASAQASLLHLGTLVADLPPQSVWSVAGIGRYQARANALGVVVGDGVRTGLEDNLWLDDERTLLATNLHLVERIAAQAAALGRSLASADQVRRRLGLAPRQ